MNLTMSKSKLMSCIYHVLAAGLPDYFLLVLVRESRIVRNNDDPMIIIIRFDKAFIQIRME